MFPVRFLKSLCFIGYRYCHKSEGDNLCKKSYPSIKAGMKILNVAEKNDAAKNLAFHLSRGNLKKVRILFNTVILVVRGYYIM